MPADPRERPAQSLNLAGSLAFTAAVMAFVVGSTVITQPGSRVAGALILAAYGRRRGFAGIDRRAAAPLLPRPLIAGRPLRMALWAAS